MPPGAAPDCSGRSLLNDGAAPGKWRRGSALGQHKSAMCWGVGCGVLDWFGYGLID